MTDPVAMTASLTCLAEGRMSPGAGLTLAILLLQVVFGLMMRTRANFAGRRFFLVANAAMAWWLLLATLEQWTVSPGCKVWFSALTYLGIALVPLSWAMFLHRYCFGTRGPIARWQRAVMVLVPAGMTAVALTSPWHGLFYGPGTGPANDLPGAPMVFVHGPLFALAAVLLYGMMLWSVVLLSRGFVAARASYRLHFGLLLLLTLAPLVANMSYVLADIAIFDFDPTPFFFIFTSMAYAVLILTNNHLDVAGIARRDFFDEYPAALAVIDSTGRLQTVNRAAAQMMTDTTLAERLREMIAAATVGGGPMPEGTPLVHGPRALRVSLRPVLSPLGRDRRTIGWMATVEDVTAWHAMIAGLTDTLREQTSELARTREASEHLQSLALRDPLTGALNRRGLEDTLRLLLTDPGPADMMTIALLDIDHFKAINDRFGHAAGDAVLVRFADVLRRTFRRGDLVFRVGGEEFLILGPGLDADTMALRLDQARETLAADPQVRAAVPDGPVRFSAGLGRWDATGARQMSEVMRAVDAALYAAKREGRNRTSVAA